MSLSVRLAYKLMRGPAGRPSPRPILLFHGLFGNKYNNRSIGVQLNKQLGEDVYLVDLRNHGDSPWQAPHTYGPMQADVERFMEEHGLQDTTVIGHSMGGKVAMGLLLGSPAVGRAVCLENAPVMVGPSSEFVKYIRAVRDVTHGRRPASILEQVAPDAAVCLFLKSLVGTPDHEKLPLDLLEDSVVKGEISAWDGCANRTNKPILFVRGTESHYVADEYILAISRHFSNFEIRDVAGAGHWVNTENPAACVEYIVDFVTRHTDA